MKEKQRKKDAGKKQIASSDNANDSDDESKSQVISSKSYIVPGNPLHPDNVNKWSKHVEEIAKNGGRQKFSDVESSRPRSRVGRHSPKPEASRSRHDMHSRKDVTENNHASKKPPQFLPKIDSAYVPRIKSPGGRILALHPDVEIPEGALHVHKTHSAMSFTVCYEPPRCLPPIPRHRSDVTNGTALDKQKRKYEEVGVGGKKRGSPSKRYGRVGSPRKVHRNGGGTMEAIRSTVEGNRQAREARNTANTNTKLEQRDQRAARLAQATDVTSRINDVKAEQDQIREQHYMKALHGFMTNKKL